MFMKTVLKSDNNDTIPARFIQCSTPNNSILKYSTIAINFN